MGTEHVPQHPVVGDGPGEYGGDRTPVAVPVTPGLPGEPLAESDRDALHLAFAHLVHQLGEALQVTDDQPVEVTFPVQSNHAVPDQAGQTFSQRPVGGLGSFQALVQIASGRQLPAHPFGQQGAATALRIASLLTLAWLGGAGTTGRDLASALVHQFRVPYRFAYGALAVLRFVPRLRTEVEVVRAAHRVRGVREGRGPVGRFRSTTRLLIPLLAGAIRHAERVALAMDARGFGAHPTRRDRSPSVFRTGDGLYLAGGLAVFVLLVWCSRWMGWLSVVGSAWLV